MTTKKVSYRTIIELIISLVSIFKTIPGVVKALEGEIERFYRSLSTLWGLYLIFNCLLLMLWLISSCIVFFLLLALKFTLLNALFILFVFHLILIIFVVYLMLRAKKNLLFHETRKCLCRLK